MVARKARWWTHNAKRGDIEIRSAQLRFGAAQTRPHVNEIAECRGPRAFEFYSVRPIDRVNSSKWLCYIKLFEPCGARTSTRHIVPASRFLSRMSGLKT